MKRILLVILLCASPCVSFALTVDEIKAQVQSMLERVAVLQAQLRIVQNRDTGTYESCLSLERTLHAGIEGEDVARLQQFLMKGGFLAEGNATGYFGSLTKAAVQKWQSQAGIVSSGDSLTTGFGVVGPKTRAAMIASCSVQAPLEGETITQPQLNVPPIVTPAATSSIQLLTPTTGTMVTGGNVLSVSWQSRYAVSGATVLLTLVDSSERVVGEIAQGLAPSGVYQWRVPQGNTDCTIGENAFDCLQKLGQCEGNPNICSIEPGTYVIRATLSDSLIAESPPFQIAGSAMSDLLRALVGAPIVLPSDFASSLTASTSVATTSLNQCVHEGQVYTSGATLSVPCTGNNCASSGTGYITGACTSGKWCIPFTLYCANVLTSIDTTAYQGGGAAAIGSGYSLGCPQEGWRAYLSCPHGGCKTGWNICRNGNWVRDTTQEVVIVGMQGSCATGQVWCGIGTGFGCVASAQCVNGSSF